MLNLFIGTIKTKILRLEIYKIARITFLKNKITCKLKQLILEITIYKIFKSMSIPNFKICMISFIILSNWIISNQMNKYNFRITNYVRIMKVRIKSRMMKYMITNLPNSK